MTINETINKFTRKFLKNAQFINSICSVSKCVKMCSNFFITMMIQFSTPHMRYCIHTMPDSIVYLQI